MPTITFIQKDGTEQTIEAEENWSIMQVAVENSIKGIEGACGGSMACATCHVYIDEAWEDRVTAEDNEQTDEEEDMLDLAFNVEDNSRLGCQVKLTQALDGLIVRLPK
jgi:2Fe-2S ferredoxin